MIPIEWTPEGQAMWAKLEEFQFDNSNAVFDFSARLAKENGWTRSLTSRVLQEYKRFLFLAMQAGHPVTPSEAVDQAWHLHLVYTRSYWQDLCTRILGRPLHHEPTAGGLDEGAKFHQQYEQTLSSYRRFFGEDPPNDIWPSIEDCFQPKSNRWIDVSRHWMLPKPSWITRLRPRLVIPAVGILMMASALVGCSELNVFDYRGEAFLKFYLGGLSLALLVSLMLVRRSRADGRLRAFDQMPTDPYEIAFLGGGGRRMIDAALAALFTRKLIVVETPSKGRSTIGACGGKRVEDLHVVERRVWEALPKGRKAEVHEVRKALKPVADDMRGTLADRGLVFSQSESLRLSWLAALPLLLMILVGLAKVFIGAARDKPVLFLIILLVGSLIVLGIRLMMMKKRTDAGESVWKQVTAEQRLNMIDRATSERSFDPSHAALTVALGGITALAVPGYEPLRTAVHHSGSSASGGCGSGCGAGGGGGCGGGGCGGCGGD